jgi:hypothetical protein
MIGWKLFAANFSFILGAVELRSAKVVRTILVAFRSDR